MTTHAELNADALAEAVVRKMKDEHHALWLDPETHATQHEFIKMLMDERAERIARRKRIEDKIAGSIILSAIVVVITLLGTGVMDVIRAALKGGSGHG